MPFLPSTHTPGRVSHCFSLVSTTQCFRHIPAPMFIRILYVAIIHSFVFRKGPVLIIQWGAFRVVYIRIKRLIKLLSNVSFSRRARDQGRQVLDPCWRRSRAQAVLHRLRRAESGGENLYTCSKKIQQKFVGNVDKIVEVQFEAIDVEISMAVEPDKLSTLKRILIVVVLDLKVCRC